MKKYFLLLLLITATLSSFAQQIIPYSHYQYQKLNKSLYNLNTRFHTSLKPVIGDDTTITAQLDSLLLVGTDRTRNSWVSRKLFNEHLVEINKEDFNVYMDFLPDFQIGRDIEHGITTWLNTRGYQIGGNIGKKFSFYSSGFENQSRFNDYLTRYIDSKNVIPGMVNDKFKDETPRRATKDWAYATAVLNYTANKYFTFTLGHDKNFIGDGYRSMVLSDVSAAYPYFKVTTTLGNVKYMAMWAQFQDPLSPVFSYDNGFRKKWGAFHYLDWNVNNRLSLGFFDSIIWQDADVDGKRGFDVSYLNPIIFLRTVEGMNSSPDNALIGFTAKYKLLRNMTVYGQLALDEFTAKEVFKGDGYWANKSAFQLGLKGFNAFKVPSLNYLVEFNTARPFTYTQRSSLLNYGHYVEALAHPMGANFKEFLTIWNYQLGKWAVSAQANYAQYGLNLSGENFGKDINESYFTRTRDNGYKTGDGLKTNFVYLDGRVSYILNPKYNLRFEAGAIFRQEKNSLLKDKTTMVTFGLRSSFRNIYQDF
ncbi:gliding motility protein RemB [Pedobacter polaris]|uniref:Gliding motility protein RemB n=1 Tax=Pedobacter polaris TaxID=2571273 RepID=A0A4U1CXG9_9SPHI|nr:gliding motility protein RemB [Pedobacter polaris]TKC13080.1 gliding motility protein RemB [Pedobacter polaris]